MTLDSRSTEKQTLPSLIGRQRQGEPKDVSTLKRQRESGAEQRRTPPKKSKGKLLNQQNLTDRKEAPVNSNTGEHGSVDKWTKVNHRKPAQKLTSAEGNTRKHQNKRPDAILVNCTESMPYADVLKMIKTAPSLQALKSNVQGIRKSENGGMILLGPSNGVAACSNEVCSGRRSGNTVDAVDGPSRNLRDRRDDDTRRGAYGAA